MADFKAQFTGSGVVSATSEMKYDPGECPLWVISGHFALRKLCPLYSRKRIFGRASDVSATKSGQCRVARGAFV